MTIHQFSRYAKSLSARGGVLTPYLPSSAGVGAGAGAGAGVRVRVCVLWYSLFIYPYSCIWDKTSFGK